MTNQSPEVKEGTTAGVEPSGPPPPPPWQPGWTAPPRTTWQDWPPPSMGGHPPLGSSRLAITGAIALLVLGILVGALGLLAMLVGMVAAGFTSNSQDAAPAMQLVLFGALLIVVSCVELIAAAGIVLHQQWARWMGVSIALITVFVSIYISVTTLPGQLDPLPGTFVAGLWLAANGFVAVALIAAGKHFRPTHASA